MPDNKYLVTPDSHQGVSHITPARLATLHRGTIAQNDYVLSVGQKFKTEIISNNVVRVYDGALIQGGIRGEIEQGDYRDVEISNGIIGMKRNYLIVCRWSVDNEDGRKTHQEIVAVEGAATEGEPQDPETNTNLIEEGAQIHDTVLYRVVKEGLDIVKIDPLFKVLMNVEELMEMQREINSKLNMEKIIIVRNNKKSAFRHPQAYGLTPVTCPDLFFDNSEGLFSHSNGAIVCNQDAIIHAHAHFVVASSAHYYTIAINNLYSDSELFYSYATSVGGYSGQTSNYFKVKKGDVISLSFGLNNSFSIAAKDLHAELDVRLVCVL